MLRLAFGYLAVAVVVAIGFAFLPDSEPTERRVASPAAKHGAKSERAYQDDGDDQTQDEENDESPGRTTAMPKTRATPKTKATPRTKATSKTRATSTTRAMPTIPGNLKRVISST